MEVYKKNVDCYGTSLKLLRDLFPEVLVGITLSYYVDEKNKPFGCVDNSDTVRAYLPRQLPKQIKNIIQEYYLPTSSERRCSEIYHSGRCENAVTDIEYWEYVNQGDLPMCKICRFRYKDQELVESVSDEPILTITSNKYLNQVWTYVNGYL